QPQWIAAATAALVLLVAVPIFIILKNAKQADRASASLAEQSRAGDAAAVKSSSQDADQRDFLSYSDGDSNVSQPGRNAESSELAASAPASDRAQEAARAATGFVAGNFNGQIAPAAPSASEVAGQKTEEKSRQVEADRLSEANQIAQNRS